jgi:hypothetical protein
MDQSEIQRDPDGQDAQNDNGESAAFTHSVPQISQPRLKSQASERSFIPQIAGISMPP